MRARTCACEVLSRKCGCKPKPSKPFGDSCVTVTADGQRAKHADIVAALRAAKWLPPHTRIYSGTVVLAKTSAGSEPGTVKSRMARLAAIRRARFARTEENVYE